MENTPTGKELSPSDEPIDAAAKLEALKKQAELLAENEKKLKKEIAQAQEDIAAASTEEKHGAVTQAVSKIRHGAEPLGESPVPEVHHEERSPEREIVVQLSDCKVPAIPYDLSRPYERIEYTADEIQKFLSTASHGHIKGRLVESSRKTASEIVVLLEETRTNLRQKFALYVELPTSALIGLPTDELERKLFMRHFRNKEAQHRVFMIGFSVALFCVIGAVLADVLNEGNQQIVTIAALVGAATTALGIVGHLAMRVSDSRGEKHAVRMIQELSLLDAVLDHFRIALR